MDYTTHPGASHTPADKAQFSFRNGIYRQAVGGRVEVARGWPNPRLWVWNRVECTPAEQLFSAESMLNVSAEMHEQLRSAYLQFVEAIDEEEGADALGLAEKYSQLKALAPLGRTFPLEVMQRVTGFREGRWALLCAQARVQGFDDLLESNPVLAWALCHQGIFRTGETESPRRHYQVLRALVRRRQRDILEWLGFPGTESVRRIFLRIQPAAARKELLLGLRDGLQDPQVECLLRHQRYLTAELLAVTQDPLLRPHLSSRLATTIGRTTYDSDSPKIHSLLVDFFKDGSELLPGPATQRQLIRFCSRAASYHLDYLEAIEEKFPPPPFAGDEQIVPLRTPQALIEEGRYMEHCVGTYVSSVAEGVQYVYAVHAPVRGTLCLHKVKGTWLPLEISGKQNQRFDPEISNAIWGRLWISNCQYRAAPPDAAHEDDLDDFLVDLAKEQDWGEEAANEAPILTRRNAETRLLGWLLLDGSHCRVVRDIVTTEDFYSPANARVFEALCKLAADGRSTDVIAVLDALGVGGSAYQDPVWLRYLNDLASNAPHHHDATYYAQIMRERSRELKDIRMMEPESPDADSDEWTD
jgi:hypothetical protein